MISPTVSLNLWLPLFFSLFNFVYAAPTPIIRSSSLDRRAAPVLVHPIHLQPIPVARVSQLFTFSLIDTTYSLPNSKFTLVASDLPYWLEFSPSTATFSGTPPANNKNALGRSTVTVTASGEGATIRDEFEVVVEAAGTGVKVGDALSKQLNENNKALTSVFVLPVGANGVGGLRVPNYWSFSIGFLSSTFVSLTSAPVRYSAFLTNGEPLPTWIGFDSSIVDFNGNAPSPTSDLPTNLAINLCASTQAGFADLCQEFTLDVASHALTLAGGVMPRLNLTSDVGGMMNVSWDVVGDKGVKGVLLDGKSVNSSDIVDLKVDTSSIPWLSWDESQRMFSASAMPDDAVTDKAYPSSSTSNPSTSSLSVPVFITDKYNDTLTFSLPISVYPSLFNSSAPFPILAAPGKPVSADLSEYLSEPNGTPDLAVVLNPQAASSWLSFSPTTGVLSSIPSVPLDLTYDTVQVNFAARDIFTHAVSHQQILLSIAPGNNATETHSHRRGPKGLNAQQRTILFAVLGSILGFALLCIVMSCCRKYVAQEKHQVDEERTEEINGWNDDEKDKKFAYKEGREQMYGVEYMTQKLAYDPKTSGRAGGLDDVPQLTTIFLDLDKPLVTGPVTPPQRKTTTTAGRFKRLIEKPLAALGGRSREGSPSSSDMRSMKSNISLPMQIDPTLSLSPTSTFDDARPRRVGGFVANQDDSSTLTGSSMGSSGSGSEEDDRTLNGDSTFEHPGGRGGSRASWESDPSYVWGNNSQGSEANSLPRRRAEGREDSGLTDTSSQQPHQYQPQSASQIGASSSDGSFSSQTTGSIASDIEETAEIGRAQRVLATPTSSKMGLSSPSVVGIGQPRLVDFKNERRASPVPAGQSSGSRSVSQSAIPIDSSSNSPPAPTISRTKTGSPPAPYDAEAAFRFSSGLTYIPNVNAVGSETAETSSPSTSAVFFTSPPMTPKSLAKAKIASPSAARLASLRSTISRSSSKASTTSSSGSTGGPNSISSIPRFLTSATSSKLARVPTDAQVVYASTTEAFSFRPTLDVDADKPVRGVLKAVIEGPEEGKRTGKGLKKLPPWLKFKQGMFDGVPKIGDEGSFDIRVIETFSGLGGQAERVVARFRIEVTPGSQLARRATGTRRNPTINGAK